MSEQELREMLERRAGTISAAPTDAPRALRRARRRLGINAALAALLGLAVLAGALTGVATLRAAPTPADQSPPGGEEPPAQLPSSGPVEPGRYFINTLAPNFDASYRITLDVPEGYEPTPGGFAVLKSDRDETGVSVWVVIGVYRDGCEGPGSRLDRWSDGTGSPVELLAAQGGFRVSAPTDVTVDGFTGSYMERRLSARVDPGGCVADRFMAWRSGGNGNRWLTFAGQQDLLWILDVDGAALVIDAALEAEASAADREEVLQMVESIQIDPR